MGEKVRYDGGHKRSAFVTSNLQDMFNLIPVCPEVGIGMSTPRPAIRVVEQGDSHRLLDAKDSSLDYTDKLADFYQQQHTKFHQLDGYILAAKSPTCGIERIKVYTQDGELAHRKGTGLFAQHIRQHYPNLPMEEDGRLNDMGLRESFITKVFIHSRFRNEVVLPAEVRNLIEFHSKHKFLVMAYSPVAYRQLGRMVANVSKETLSSTQSQYLTLLMSTVSKPTNRKKHTNVLMHLQGFLKKQLSKEDKQELAEQINKYRLGYVPLLAPITLLLHFLKQHPNPYLSQQVYLHPYPEELRLRA